MSKYLIVEIIEISTEISFHAIVAGMSFNFLLATASFHS